MKKFSMGMRDIGEMLDKIKGPVDNDDTSNRLVKKSLPAKPEWVKSMKELHLLADKMCKMKDDMITGRKKIWAQIELGLDDFSSDKRWNDETKEIEILVDKDGKSEPTGLMKSPFQKGGELE